MDYLDNYTDVTKISQTGWGGSKTFEDGILKLTAINGWNSYGWASEDWAGKSVVFEFDYLITPSENWNWLGLGTGDSVAYFSDGVMALPQGKWGHRRITFSEAKKVIGLNVRGTDKTGETYVVKIKNVRIHDQVPNVTVRPTGIVKAGAMLETDIGNAFFGPDSVSAAEFVEI